MLVQPSPRFLLDGLSDASRRRIGALLYGTPGKNDHDLGTGTLLRHGTSLYLLTCEHVARGFFCTEEAWINFYESERRSKEVRRPSVTLVLADSKLDVAVLSLSSPTARDLDSLDPITVQHLGNRADYIRARRAVPTHPQYGVCGWSGELADYARDDLIAMRPMSYATHPCESHPPNTITFAYTETDDGARPPRAPGLSGSLVWELDPDAGGEIWSPGKAIAMQNAWTEGRRLLCSPVYALRRWIIENL